MRPPGSVSLLLMEQDDLTNKTHRALKGGHFMRRMKHEGKRACTVAPAPHMHRHCITLTIAHNHGHRKPAHMRGSLGKHTAIN